MSERFDDEHAAARAATEIGIEPDEQSAEDVSPDDEIPVVESGDDAFDGWPSAESATVIEESPAEGVSVEHVRGEIDVPDGFTVLEGTPLGNKRSVGVVVSRFNGGVTNRMLQTALETLIEAGVSQDGITVMPVPGAFELPLAAMALAKTRRYACIVALGAVVRGETPHFDYVAQECASGLQLAGLETGVPVAFDAHALTAQDPADPRAGGQPDDAVAGEGGLGDDLGNGVPRDGQASALELQAQFIRHSAD